jgi:hypothetical protein
VFTIEIEGAEAVNKTLDTMAAKIDELGKQDMARELTAWQSEDMKRRFPNTSQDDDKTVSTEIFPRSRLSKQRKPTLFTKPVRQVYVKPPGIKQIASTRPILRDELWIKLRERMNALMSETLKWITG